MALLLLILVVASLAGFTLLAWLLMREGRRRSAAETERETLRGSLAGAHAQLDAERRARAADHAEVQPKLARLTELATEVERLSPWVQIADADGIAKQLFEQGRATLRAAKSKANDLLLSAEREATAVLARAREESERAAANERSHSRQLVVEATAAREAALAQARSIVEAAERRAEEIAGEAIEAVRNAARFERTAKAMKNVIDGYGDEYLLPAESLLDQLAGDFGHKEAGQRLKSAREHSRRLIKSAAASVCEYVEQSRRQMAERFVLDAFVGKVDSILSRVRHDNFGTLDQEIKDAFTLVNHQGRAFRDARVTDEFLEARREELKWAVVAQELRRLEQDEQRRAREQVREEAKARRDIERAMREAKREEDVIREAITRAEAQAAAASAEQRASFEEELRALAARLEVAEQRGQRAVSMAQQTRRGHVYVISNVGSFGEHLYKIGVTRRLDPMDRIFELGDSSVPFDFDVHALILSDDAPSLEFRLHRHFLLKQANKVDHRKEFFRLDLKSIREEIEAMGIEAQWTMTAEAREFRETLLIERMIAEDPVARQAWIDRQLTLESLEPSTEDESREATDRLMEIPAKA